MSSRVFFLLLLLAGRAVAAEKSKAAAVVLPLPPLARVMDADGSGTTWRQSGELTGTVEGACNEFRQALHINGWHVEKVIATGRHTARVRMLVCCRRRQRVLVMVWEKEAGRCGFAWGMDA